MHYASLMQRLHRSQERLGIVAHQVLGQAALIHAELLQRALIAAKLHENENLLSVQLGAVELYQVLVVYLLHVVDLIGDLLHVLDVVWLEGYDLERQRLAAVQIDAGINVAERALANE